MTEKEKLAFFQNTSQHFYSLMREMPSKMSKTKKKVSFLKFFDVKPFKENEIPTKISETKVFKDSYREEHSS